MILSYLLDLLGMEYVHIVVRRKLGKSFEYLGGGNKETVSKRYGKCEVDCATIQDNIFVVYIK